MTVEEKITQYGEMLRRGHIALSEAERLMDGAIVADCLEYIDWPNAWSKRYIHLKRRAWKALLKATNE